MSVRLLLIGLLVSVLNVRLGRLIGLRESIGSIEPKCDVGSAGVCGDDDDFQWFAFALSYVGRRRIHGCQWKSGDRSYQSERDQFLVLYPFSDGSSMPASIDSNGAATISWLIIPTLGGAGASAAGHDL